MSFFFRLTKQINFQNVMTFYDIFLIIMICVCDVLEMGLAKLGIKLVPGEFQRYVFFRKLNCIIPTLKKLGSW